MHHLVAKTSPLLWNSQCRPVQTLLVNIAPHRFISRVHKTARLLPKKIEPLLFTKSGKRIYNKKRFIFNENKRLNWLAEHRDIDGAVKLFNAFENEYGVKPDRWTWSTLTKAYVLAEKYQEALDTVENMKKAGFQLDPATKSLMFTAYGKLGQKDKVLELVKELESQPRGLNKLHCLSALKALPVGKESLSDAKALLERVKKISPKNYLVRNAYIQACLNAGDVAAAKEAWSSGRKEKNGYLVWLSHHCGGATGSASADMRAAEALVTEMRQRKISVGAPVYECLIRGWAANNEMEKAHRVVYSMYSAGVVVAASSYQLLIGEYLRKNMVPQALITYDEMVEEKHLFPTLATLDALIVAAAPVAENNDRVRQLARTASLLGHLPKLSDAARAAVVSAGGPAPETTSAAASAASASSATAAPAQQATPAAKGPAKPAAKAADKKV